MHQNQYDHDESEPEYRQLISNIAWRYKFSVIYEDTQILKKTKDGEQTILSSIVETSRNKLCYKAWLKLSDEYEYDGIPGYEEFTHPLKEINGFWDHHSRYSELSEKTIRNRSDEVNWTHISAYQTLSEDFIREFRYSVNWKAISRHQQMSEDFVLEFIDKINLNEIQYNYKLHHDVREKIRLIIKEKIDKIKEDHYQFHCDNKTKIEAIIKKRKNAKTKENI